MEQRKGGRERKGEAEGRDGGGGRPAMEERKGKEGGGGRGRGWERRGRHGELRDPGEKRKREKRAGEERELSGSAERERVGSITWVGRGP